MKPGKKINLQSKESREILSYFYALRQILRGIPDI